MPTNLAIEEAYQRRVRDDLGFAIEDVMARLMRAVEIAADELDALGVLARPDASLARSFGDILNGDKRAQAWYVACARDTLYDHFNRDGELALSARRDAGL